MSEKILIAGAGYVGMRAAELFVAQGFDVTILRRSSQGILGSKLIQADLLQPETLKNLPVCDHLIYCAAADHGGELAYEGIYLRGLQNLLKALSQQAPIPHVMFTSSTSVYAEASGHIVDENSENLVQQGSSRFIVAAEQYLQQGPWTASILRFGGIYGPGRTSFLRRIRQQQELIWDGEPIYSNRIHREDCAGIMLFLLQNPLLRGKIYNGVDCDPAERNVLIRWLCEQLKLSYEDLRHTKNFAEIPHRGNKRVSNQRLLDAGYHYSFPSFREGYTGLMDEL